MLIGMFVVAEVAALRETEERLKQQHSDLLLREKVLVRRLAAKEQEMQEYAVSVLFCGYSSDYYLQCINPSQIHASHT